LYTPKFFISKIRIFGSFSPPWSIVDRHNYIFGIIIQDKELFYASVFAHGDGDFYLTPKLVTGDVQGLSTNQFHSNPPN
jgi:hypothetical protein